MNGWWGVVLGVVLSLLVNEFCDVSPWLAKHLVPLAVRLWTRDEEMREVYREEWQRVASDAPGKLVKLLVAFGFLAGGVGRFAGRSGANLFQRLRDSRAVRFARGPFGAASVYMTAITAMITTTGVFLVLNTGGWIAIGITAVTIFGVGFIVRILYYLPRKNMRHLGNKSLNLFD